MHEIKHDGFRIIAYRDAAGVRLLTRKGFDLADRFILAATAIASLPAHSCVIDGEAIACDQRGLSVFDMIRWRQHDNAVTLCAFDLLELDGEDLRREPIEVRKAALKGLLRRAHPGITFNRHFEADGTIVYGQASALGCEGIVSKRLGITIAALVGFHARGNWLRQLGRSRLPQHPKADIRLPSSYLSKRASFRHDVAVRSRDVAYTRDADHHRHGTTNVRADRYQMSSQAFVITTSR